MVDNRSTRTTVLYDQSRWQSVRFSMILFGWVLVILGFFVISSGGTPVDAHAVHEGGKRRSVTINVRDYGIVGDGRHDDTDVFQSLLRSNTVVYIPSHVAVTTGPLRLVSNLILYVDGTLQAWDATSTATNNSSNIVFDRWPIIVPPRIYNTSEDGGHPMQYQAFLYGTNVTNVRITGNGTINGRGEPWWDAFTNRGKNSSKYPLLKAGRPNLIQFVDSHNIEIDTVTLRDSPFWTVHPILSTNVHIHHITIRSRLYAPNVDGIDPDACRDVLVEYNDVSCGDDHVAIKAGRCGDVTTPTSHCTDPIWKSGTYQSTNVTVRYNIFRTGMGIAVGSESSGGIRNVRIHDNVIGLCDFGSTTDTSCGWGPALHMKTTITRGGTIEDVVFHDNVIYNTSVFILLEMNYQSSNVVPPKDYAPTVVRNVSFVRNRAMGMATSATFGCSVNDVCHDIIVINNTIDHATTTRPTSPWSCHFVQSYNVAGNVPKGLEECMANSMNQTTTTPTTTTLSSDIV